MEEVWLPIEDNDNYEISSLANVRSVLTGKTISQWYSKNVDLRGNRRKNITLYKNGKKTNHYISILVAKAFIPNPEELPIVDHININCSDNSISNLRWVSNRDNNRNRPKNFTNKTSKYTGVSYNKKAKKWYVQLRLNDKNNQYQGSFDTEIDAAEKWNEMVKLNNLQEFYPKLNII